jgi:hypothetical protein
VADAIAGAQVEKAGGGGPLFQPGAGLANKTARIIWAMLVSGEIYRRPAAV